MYSTSHRFLLFVVQQKDIDWLVTVQIRLAYLKIYRKNGALPVQRPPVSFHPGTVSSGCKPPCPWNSMKVGELLRPGGIYSGTTSRVYLFDVLRNSHRHAWRIRWPWRPASNQDQVAPADGWCGSAGHPLIALCKRCAICVAITL